ARSPPAGRDRAGPDRPRGGRARHVVAQCLPLARRTPGRGGAPPRPARRRRGGRGRRALRQGRAAAHARGAGRRAPRPRRVRRGGGRRNLPAGRASRRPAGAPLGRAGRRDATDRQPSTDRRGEPIAMKRTLLKSKIHRATVTDANLHYQGSVTVDPLLMAAADLVPWERVEIYNCTNGERFATYAIPGTPGQG